MLFRHSFLPTEGRQPRQKLEEYAQLYARYTILIQQQGDLMRHDSGAMKAAYDLVIAEFATEQRNYATDAPGPSQVLSDLNEYARRCSMNSTSFENRVRIAFAASSFVQVLMNFVIGKLDKKDMEWVLARATRLMSLTATDPIQPIPTFAPAISKFKPDNAVTLSVTSQDVAHWQSKPEELVGKCFITTEEIMRRTFFVQDYGVKLLNGPQFDVLFEDTGLEVVNTLDTDTLLTMVREAELVVS